jgi:hypothetical protein
MKTPDYLHSNLLENPKNDLVFQKTYQAINQLSREYKRVLKATGVSGSQLDDYHQMYVKITELVVTNLINETIHNFEK